MEENKTTNSVMIKDFFKKLPKLFKTIIIIIIIFACVYFGIMLKSNFLTETKSTKFGLEDIGELVTQTCYVTVVNDSKENRDFFNLFDVPFTESRQIFSYDVEVDASLDFSNISYTPNEEKMEILIKLPHAKIYKSTLNLFSLKVYLDSESWFSRINLEKQNDALKAIEEQAVIDAKANGIIEAADKNAKTLIEGLIKGNDKYKDYKVIYEYID